MENFLSILPWLGLFIGSAMFKYYLWGLSQSVINRPEMFWNPIGHLVCLGLIGIGVWSAFFVPWLGVVLLFLFVPNVLVLFDLLERAFTRKPRERGSEPSQIDSLASSQEESEIRMNPGVLVHYLLRQGGLWLSEQDDDLLWKEVENLSHDDCSKLKQYESIAMKGFFHAAQKGEAFVPLSLIKDEFGKTLGEIYPEASQAFMNMAQSYWTMKVILLREDFRANTEAGHSMLAEVEMGISSVFFPSPGQGISSDLREEKQRELLNTFCPAIDEEEFISGNPILLRDRR